MDFVGRYDENIGQTSAVGREPYPILKASIKTTRMRAIRIWVLSIFLILSSSCGVDRKDRLSISLIDVFEVHPALNKSGNIIKPGQLHLTLAFNNRGDRNYVFCFDSWLKEKKDSITCFIRVPCRNGKAMDLSLGYITHPQVLLPSNTTDTVTLEANYRELHDFYENCQE